MRKLFSLGSVFLGSEKLRLNSVSNEQSRMEGETFWLRIQLRGKGFTLVSQLQTPDFNNFQYYMRGLLVIITITY